jgi:glycerol dehydrogenase
VVNSIVFPGRYIQGQGALEYLSSETLRFGKSAFLIASPTPFIKVLPDIKKKIDKALHLVTERFGGECSDEEIARLLNLAQDIRADVIIGMGGGKTLDTAKAVASQLKIPVIIIPTIASSDAPCSAISVIYSPEGELKRVVIHPFNPDVVLVDTGLIIQAPVRYLVAGMGDALSTNFEAESCRKKQANNVAGYHGAMTAYDLAGICYQNLLRYGIQAKFDCDAHQITPAFEHIVETNILLSGIGFESGGVAAAHAIHHGLLTLKEAQFFLHGELVAFGTLASLFLTKKPKDVIEKIYTFCESIGLPTTLSDIGLGNASDEDILTVAKSTCVTDIIYNEPSPITARLVSNAIKKADLFGRKRENLNI